MNNPSEKLRNMRLDLSPYLFHFTDSIDTLWVILGELCLKSPKHNYVCFTETPLCMMVPMLDYMAKTKKPMLGKFGIGFKRDMLIEDYGARPVIYCDFLDKSIILPQNCKVISNPPYAKITELQNYWEHSDVAKDIETCGYYVDNIVPHYDNGEFYDADFDIKRLYRCVALDELKKEIKDNILGDYELKAIIEKQKIDEIVEL